MITRTAEPGDLAAMVELELAAYPDVYSDSLGLRRQLETKFAERLSPEFGDWNCVGLENDRLVGMLMSFRTATDPSVLARRDGDVETIAAALTCFPGDEMADWSPKDPLLGFYAHAGFRPRALIRDAWIDDVSSCGFGVRCDFDGVTGSPLTVEDFLERSPMFRSATKG